ncbi:MAG: LysR family transcriptional regulator [Deltaproteobacteria bacterium]|nr:LysR family transcriptional regulator [Deltaproteobacteria bacterium]MBI3387371.1 LysR family transcriptional regulator [Deltaproteobacteria bacterium]
MHIETLRVFCDVVETGSFSAAASQNYITQSAVSQQLRALESRYQCTLLERSRHGAKPTPAGEILYRVSREILEKYQEIEAQLQETGNVVAGNLRVAIVYSVGLHELPPHLKEYMRTYPQVNVHVEYARPNKIYDSVIAGQIDLGIVAYPQKHPQVTNLPWREDRMVLACPPDHAFATLKKVSISKLNGQNFVAYEQDIPTRKATDQLLREHQVTVNLTGEFDNIETIKRAVEIGQGAAIIPLAAIRHELEHGTLKAVQLNEATLLRPVGIIHKKNRHLSPAAVKFIEILHRQDLR